MAPKSILKRLEADTINKELIDTIEGFIQKNHTQALAKIFDELQPADAADVIEHLSPGELSGLKCGEAIACRNRHKDHRGCGYSEVCPDCPLLMAIRAALCSGGETEG
jgi:hypothetical protein